MNALTKKGVLSEDKLFATLETRTGDAWIGDGEHGVRALVHDTIGFIRDLPPDLIEAFRSTLEDSIESDVLLHVIDAGDPRIEEKLATVENILADIGAAQPRIHVFNKSDTLSEREIVLYREKYAILDPVFVSAADRTGVNELKTRMYHALLEFL